MAWQAALAVVSVVMLVFSACGGAHLYRPANQQLAQDAVEAFGRTNLLEGLDEKREPLARMLEHAIEIVRRHEEKVYVNAGG